MELVITGVFDVADVGKPDARTNLGVTDDICHAPAVFRIGSQGAGAEGKAVIRALVHAGNLDQIILALADAGQTEEIVCRIVRVDTHLDVVFLAGRHDGV